MKDRRRRTIVALAGLVLATAAACSGEGSNQSSEPSETDAAVDGVAQESLRFQLYQEPTTFNPITATQGADAQIIGLNFRGLVSLIDGEYVGDLAESVDTNDDATEFTFNLREVNWSDGEPFTADDVIFSLEAYLHADSQSPYAGPLTEIEGATDYTAGDAGTITGVSAPDENTVVLTIGTPNVAFLANLNSIKMVPQHVLEAVDFADWAGDPFFREPTVGIGPYIFSRWVNDDQIEFVANDEFWVDPKLETVYGQFLATDVARAQLETGEINIAQLQATDVADVEALEDVDIISAEGNTVLVLMPAVDKAPLDDVRVRQAIMYAIDREAIVENVIAGQGQVVDSVIYTPDWAQNTDLEPYDYDPDRARELLAEAGWDASVEVNLGIVPGQADREAVLAIVSGQLQEVGINAQVQTFQAAALGEAVAAGEFDTIITILGAAGEPASIRGNLACNNVRPDGTNFTAWCDEEFDQLMIEGVTVADPAERAPYYQQVQSVLHEELPMLPLYAANSVYGVTRGVTGVHPAALTTTAENWEFTQ